MMKEQTYISVNRLLLYRDFERQQLLDRLCSIVNGYERAAEHPVEREKMIGELYACAHELLELAAGHGRVVDIAAKYGYESPDSFARAFQRFHGATPSQVRDNGVPPRQFAPLRIKMTVEGGCTLPCRLQAALLRGPQQQAGPGP